MLAWSKIPVLCFMGAKKLLMTLLPVARDSADHLMSTRLWWAWLIAAAVWLVAALLIARAASVRDGRALFAWSWVIGSLMPVALQPYAERFTYVLSIGFTALAALWLAAADIRLRPGLQWLLLVVFLVCALSSTIAACGWTDGGCLRWLLPSTAGDAGGP
jgi:hypothetical protein